MYSNLRDLRSALTVLPWPDAAGGHAGGGGGGRTAGGVRGMDPETFPAGNARLTDAARVDADTTWAVGSRVYGKAGGGTAARWSSPVTTPRPTGRRYPCPTGTPGS